MRMVGWGDTPVVAMSCGHCSMASMFDGCDGMMIEEWESYLEIIQDRTSAAEGISTVGR